MEPRNLFFCLLFISVSTVSLGGFCEGQVCSGTCLRASLTLPEQEAERGEGGGRGSPLGHPSASGPALPPLSYPQPGASS